MGKETNLTIQVRSNVTKQQKFLEYLIHLLFSFPRNDLPGLTCQFAVHELISLSFNAATNAQVLCPYIEQPPSRRYEVQFQHRNKLKAKLDDMRCMEISNFEEQFRPVFERNQLEDKKRQLQLKLSDEGMALYPDYLNMVALLKHLRYIDSDERGLCITIKVFLMRNINVACE